MAKIRYGVCNAMVEVLNEEIESLPSEVLEQLDCGDFIIKVTGDQKHRYFVSYKEAGVGMCFTYADAGCVETISYDCVDGEWVFNSKDVSESKSDEAVKELAKEEVESAESGTIDNALGLDSEGNLVKGAISGGTKLYQHNLTGKLYDRDETQIGTFDIKVITRFQSTLSGMLSDLISSQKILFLLEGNNRLKLNNVWHDVISFTDLDHVLVNSSSNGLEVMATNDETASGKIYRMIINNDTVIEL